MADEEAQTFKFISSPLAMVVKMAAKSGRIEIACNATDSEAGVALMVCEWDSGAVGGKHGL